jgi:pyruvate/2-oxoacid:ferredoxin oxidoreductase alpha subunit
MPAAERLNAAGISTNHLHFKFLMPFHAQEAARLLGQSRRIVMVEHNQSGQFARHLRAETGIAANAHIRKYDGEPFEPKHIVAAVKEILEKGTEVVNLLSTEPGWRTEHPSGTSADWPGRRVSNGAAPVSGVGSKAHVH